MFFIKCAVLSAILYVGSCASNYTFPPGFLFGAGTSSFQIEGAWNVSDKGESIWDRYTHQPGHIPDGGTGDVACDSYHLWQQDIDIAVAMGLDFYKFSISWPRMLPTGLANLISEDGQRYYNNLINELLEKGIEPVVTMYHWEMPQRLQNLGGWSNPLLADWFSDYARILFSLFGDRVKTWITINEPMVICDMSYSNISIAPDVVDQEVGRYLCSKHVLLAHAKAWRVYDEEFRSSQKGQIGYTNHIVSYEPYGEGDEESAELAMQQCVGRYSHPVYSKEGGWPPYLEKAIAEKSKADGFPFSRLPAFTQEEINLIRGTYDYYGVNHYTSRLVRKLKPGESAGIFPVQGEVDLGLKFEVHPDWKAAITVWLKENPAGFRRILSWLKKEYGDIKIFVLENGYASAEGLDDQDRINYHKTYLEQLLLAMVEDKVDVIGYTAWSLMDNFEWFDGYQTKFGLYEVDFNDPNRTRTPRRSAQYYTNVIKSRSVDVSDIKYRTDEL